VEKDRVRNWLKTGMLWYVIYCFTSDYLVSEPLQSYSPPFILVCLPLVLCVDLFASGRAFTVRRAGAATPAPPALTTPVMNPSQPPPFPFSNTSSKRSAIFAIDRSCFHLLSFIHDLSPFRTLGLTVASSTSPELQHRPSRQHIGKASSSVDL
jgi:hypothetical protein